MTESLFRQSFLLDTLDDAQPIATKRRTLDNGVTLILHQRGVLEVLPANYQAPHERKTVTTDDVSVKSILISSGIHGDETAPMELISSLVDDIESGFQPVAERCLFVIAHPQATRRHTRFIDENLNRLFDSKSHPKTTETEIATWLKLLAADFFADTTIESRWHLDLHCAIRLSKHYSFAVSPKTRHPIRTRALVDFVSSAHIDALLLSNSPSSTFSWFTAEHFSTQALTVELGQVAPIGENDLHRLIAFDMTLRDLIANVASEHLPKPPVMYRVSRTIVRVHDDFAFLFGDDVENFTTFKHGEVFGHDGDKPLMAKNENEAVVFANPHVAIGQRAALMVCTVKTRYEGGQLVYD
ncbi:succinylglutamate desuccinylase [Vibrio sp. SM6]|uniref:Succinylglutamate desuccinylase n=1 Tax=Vibrio agarilyticus TaxID=2726741 RepID=A0A7X8TQW0_9VIBR|nr:succinylglutamate desuccinylase [Vibrio agarilyticus]NLS12932.1 succinylglutamate desuccinylase [Vibrio agarilyticus]